MTIVVNGEPHAADTGVRVDAVVAELGAMGAGTAVAVNGEVVPRSAWGRHELTDGDRVEVLRAVSGG